METLTLTKVYRSTTKKDGTPLVTKAGKPYERVSIQAEETGDTWVSGFGNDKNKVWAEGDKIQVLLEKSGDFTNFKMPNANPSRAEFDDLVKRIELLEGASNMKQVLDSPTDDIPF